MRRVERGFTLVEVLIALGVFAILSAVSVGIIRLATNAQEQAEDVAGSIARIERARSIIRMDMLQIVDRRYRPAGTNGQVAAFTGGAPAKQAILTREDEEEILLAFVRNGWANPDYRQPRASLQQVTYLVRDGALIRRVQPFIDAVEDTPYRDQLLFDGVTGVQIGFYGPSGWVEDWGAGSQSTPPPAIRLSFTDPEFGALTQDFLVGGGR
ncbi:type II secretion system minor pseudopilin GspJ [Parvularcula marina]|uniref:Type II secretion system protein J n=1 Tax=Parvularcula marina TaxID=2292771 RepID=A0A371R856_9PROT|nr:type II secretion system minor pseudopilin GspJ [Parvularcula marina]RFB01647.1 type II secretion system protein GspJ [Parvularcula marina]